MASPPALTPGDKIGVMAPSSFVEEADIEQSQKLLEDKGYEVFIHPQSYAQHNQSAGTHEEKISALEELWQNPDIKAIWAAGGGNRALHLLDHINFKALPPKILIGFSDVTALLNALYAHTGMTSFHGPVFKNLHKMDHGQLEQGLALMSGATDPYPLDGAKILQEGQAEGPLIGGCLSIFQYLAGTKDGPELNGAILFLEDAGDHLSRMDRMLLHLKRTGVFEQISGLVLGEFHDLQEGARPFGFTLEELVLEHTENTSFPIVMNAPFGHGPNLLTYALGVNTVLDTKTGRFQSLSPAVSSP